MRVAARMLLVWLAVFLAKSSPVAGAPPLEARCSQLGAVCLCSEPMNWLQDGGALYGGITDPADSEGPEARECGGAGLTADWDPIEPVWNSVPVPDRPASASADWQYVQRITHNGVNEYNWWYGVPASTSRGTVCTRSYQNIGTLPWMTDPTQRIKIAQWTGNLQETTQLEWAWDQSVLPDGYVRGQSPYRYGEVVSFDDCRGAWCRFEFCVDFNGLSTAWRARITRVDTPGKAEVMGPVFQPTLPTSPLEFAVPSDVSIADLYTQCADTGGCLQGTRHIAFGIQTLIEPENRNFWPGPAYEVEGEAEPTSASALGAGSSIALCLLLGAMGWALQRRG